MSSTLDSYMEQMDEAETIRIAEMSAQDAKCAVQWMTERIRSKTGNSMLVFPAEWMPLTGLAAKEGGTLRAVATLYLEMSAPVAVCGWCVTNPQNSVTASRSAVVQLMTEMPHYAKKFGAKHLLTIFGNRGINRILDDLGFCDGEASQHKYKLL